MLGAIVGDTIGSVYEIHNIKTTDFNLFQSWSRPTDDSVMTMAVAEWLLKDKERSALGLEQSMVNWGFRYPHAGYGPAFRKWLFSPYLQNMDLYAPHIERGEEPDKVQRTAGIRRPYNSWGNGSAMRCSACGWVANTLDEALDLAKRSAGVSHNHPEGIKGAQATAAAIYLARQGKEKNEIRQYVEDTFGYDLSKTCNEIRPTYTWDVSCQGTMPAAFAAFFDSTDFESAIRLAVSLGGDSDTIACITGGIAEAYYKQIPAEIVEQMTKILDHDWWKIIRMINKDPLKYNKT